MEGSSKQAPVRLCYLQLLRQKEQAGSLSDPFTFPLRGCALLI